MPALPFQALLGVVGRPHVEGRERLDAARIGDGELAGDLRPGADPDAVGLGDPTVTCERFGGRLSLGPDPLLERAGELGLVGLAHQVVALVVEGRIQEEALVLDAKALRGLADPTLAKGDQLLALGEGADGDRPFFESNWHWKEGLSGSSRAGHGGSRRDGP